MYEACMTRSKIIGIIWASSSLQGRRSGKSLGILQKGVRKEQLLDFTGLK